MNPWLETSGVLLLGIAGVALGCWFSSLRRPYWTLGYFIPLTIIVLIGLAYRLRTLEFCPLFCWLMTGRREFALTALFGSMVLTTPLSRLRLRPDGLTCDYRAFKSVSELKRTGCTLALMKFAFLLDHYVTVLSIDDQNVTIGDPLNGKQTVTHAEFARHWRFVGVLVKRNAQDVRHNG